MATALLLAWKDLRQRLRDRSFLIMGIIAPLVITFILTSVAGDAFDGAFEPTFVIHDESGLVGEGLVQVLVTEVGFEDVSIAESRDAALTAVEQGDASAAILLPATIVGEEPAEIEVVGNRAEGLATSVAAAIAEGLAEETRAARLAGAGLAASGVTDPAGYAGVGSMPQVIDVVDVGAGNRVLDGRTYLAVGMAIFFLFFTVQAAVMNVLEEQQNGTLQRLLVAPVGRASILLGKTLAAALTGFMAMAVLVAATTVMLGADWGPVWGVVVLSVAAVGAAMGLGALLATITRTAEQAGQFGGIVATVLGLLGGVFFPVTGDTPWLEAVSRISPHRWLLIGFGENAGTGSPADVLLPAAVVLGMGLALSTVAIVQRSRLTGVV